MFGHSTSNSLSTTTNDSCKLSASIFTKFISDKKIVGYMGRIYRAQLRTHISRLQIPLQQTATAKGHKPKQNQRQQNQQQKEERVRASVNI